MKRAMIVIVSWAVALSLFLGRNDGGVPVLWAASPGADALVAAYGFDEGAGMTVTDASGKQHTGTLTNTTWSTTGRFGGALSFNGTNSLVTVNDSALLDLPNGMTLQAWVFPTALSGWRTAILKERTGGLTYGLYAHDNVPRPAAYLNVAAGDVAASGSASLPLNTWTHLAAAYNGSVLTIFVNGEPVGSQVVSGASLTSSGALRIGGNSVWGEYFSGLIDEVRVHNRALTQSEIQGLMVTPVNQTFGFEILAYNPILSMGLGDMDVYQFELMPLGGFTGPVVPSVAGLPPGTTGTWEPTGGPPHPGPFALVVNTGLATPPGTYELMATVVNGALSASKTLSLTVSNVPGFRVIAEPNSLIITQGQSGEAIFEVVQENGFSGSVSMSVNGMPAGVTASFTPSAPSTAPFAGTVTFNVGSSVAPGVYPLLVTATSGTLVRQASFALTVLQGGTAGSWRQQALGDTPAMFYGVIVGDIGNTGQNRVIASGGQGVMYAYTYNGTSWSVSQMPFNDPADGEMHNMAIGPGRNDGINRLYIAAVSTGRVYEVSWVNGAWQVGIIATLTGATDVAIGNGRNDGVQRLYVTWMSGTTELTRTGSTWSQVTLSSNETGWVHGMDLGPGRNDGVNRIYTANQNAGPVYEYSWNGSAWTKLLVGSSSDTRNVKMGDGRNDGLIRLYAASGDSNVYEYTWNGTAWQSVAMGNAGVAGVKVHSVPARTKPDGRVRVYAAASNGGVYEYEWTGSAWQTTAMGLATAYMYGLDVGDGLNKGTTQVYGSSYDGNTYIYEWVPTNTTPVLVTVPNVMGQTQSGASTSLTAVGLVTGTITNLGSLTVPIGQVTGQAPAANTHVPQGSAVNLTVSSGVAVPNVVGQTQAGAGAAIVGAGLAVGNTTSASSNTVAVGSVISQSPLAGVRVNGGSSVALVVSSGPSATTTKFPSGVTILTGTLNGGNAAALTSDDNVYFAVNSTTSGTRTTSWYGSFSTVPSTLSNLRVNYRGNNSANCTQTVAIWRWSDSTWVQLDSRNVSTTEIAINNLTPSGTLANYVSASGQLRVRIQCTRTTNFIARGELMSISYDAPVGPPPPDTTAPVRSNGAPSGTLVFGTTQATLSLSTNENASCRYATSAGISYDSMVGGFSTTGGSAHSTLVSGLANGGSYSFYIRCRDASVNANTNGDDYLISFAVSSQASQSFQASVDFSTTQGFRNWFYLYGTGTQMSYVNGTGWRGNETYLLLYLDGGHPGNAADGIRRWRAPQAGTINVTGRAFDQDGSCGSGNNVSIRKNGTNLWQQAIANGNTTGFSFNLTTTVAAGDNIDFVINRGADNVNYCDATGFDPTIIFTP